MPQTWGAPDGVGSPAGLWRQAPPGLQSLLSHTPALSPGTSYRVSEPQCSHLSNGTDNGFQNRHSSLEAMRRCGFRTLARGCDRHHSLIPEHLPRRRRRARTLGGHFPLPLPRPRPPPACALSLYIRHFRTGRVSGVPQGAHPGVRASPLFAAERYSTARRDRGVRVRWPADGHLACFCLVTLGSGLRAGPPDSERPPRPEATGSGAGASQPP